MKNLRTEVQAQADLLKNEQQQLQCLLAAPHLLGSADAIYEAERDMLRVTSELRALSWVQARMVA